MNGAHLPCLRHGEPRREGWPATLAASLALLFAACSARPSQVATPAPAEETADDASQAVAPPDASAEEPAVDATPPDAAGAPDAEPVVEACPGEPMAIPARAGRGCPGGRRRIDYRALFTDVHPDPQVTRSPSRIAGIEIVQTYDRSQAAEDPLVPRCWLVTASGRRFDFYEGIGPALAEACFALDTPAAALAAAALSLDCAGGTDSRVLDDPGNAESATTGLPEEAVARVCPPRVFDRGDHYEVLLDVHRNRWRARFFGGSPDPSIERLVVRVGPGRYEVDSSALWPPPAPTAPASPGR
jgi:hypothetical protein